MPRTIIYLVVFFGVWSLDLLVNAVNSGRKAWVPKLALDDQIPYVAVFIYPYSIYFPLIILPLFLFFRSPEPFERYIIASVMVMLASYAIFLALPTKLIRIRVEPNSTANKLTLLYHRLVAPTNLFPSLHVSQLLVLYLTLQVYSGSLAALLAIPIGLCALSIVLTKQHYLLDLLAALPLGWLAFYMSSRVQDWLK